VTDDPSESVYSRYDALGCTVVKSDLFFRPGREYHCAHVTSPGEFGSKEANKKVDMSEGLNMLQMGGKHFLGKNHPRQDQHTDIIIFKPFHEFVVELKGFLLLDPVDRNAIKFNLIISLFSHLFCNLNILFVAH